MPGSIPLPTYGAFGGNGDNDAWEQSSRYITWVLNGNVVDGVPMGQVPVTTDANGHASVVAPPSYMQRYELPHIAENIGAVTNIMAQIGREPIDALDGMYLRHDLLSVTDQTISAAQNNFQTGSGLFTALTNSGDYGFYGTTYGYLAAFGLPTVGTVIQEFQNFGPNYNPANDQSLTYVDETTVEPVIVVAVRDSNGVVHALVDGVIELTAAVYQAGASAWNSFTASVGYTWQSFTGFISDTAAGFGGILDKAWNFVKDLFTDNNVAGRDFAADDVGHQKLVLTETKEKNTQHDKDVLALLDSLQQSGAIEIVNLSSPAQVAHYLASTEARASVVHTIDLAEPHAIDTVHLVGALETPLIAA